MRAIPRYVLTRVAATAAACFGLHLQPAPAAAAPAAVAPAAAPADPFAGLAAMDFGGERAAAAAVEAQVRDAPPAGYAEIERKILAVMADPKATRAAKQFCCRTLRVVGSDACVAPLAALLGDAELSHMARYALENLPSAQVNPALRAQLAAVADPLKAGIAGTLGARGDAGSVPALAPLASAKDAAVAAAALNALGRIGGAAAVAALEAAQPPPELAALRADALLRGADSLAARDAAAARAIYAKALAGPAGATRAAALTGLAALDGAKAAPQVLAALTGDDAVLARAAGKAIPLVAARDVAPFAAQLPAMRPEAQVMTLTALGALAKPGALPAVKQALASPEEAVRAAAIRALATLGDAACAVALLETAGKPDEPGKAAVETLSVMKGKGIDEALLAKTKAGDPLRAVAVETLRNRSSKALLPLLLDPASYTDAAFVKTAAGALKDLAGPKEFPKMLDLMEAIPDAGLRHNVEKAIAAVAMRMPDPDAACGQLGARMSKSGPEGRKAALTIVGQLGGPKAQAAMEKALADPDAEIRKTAIRALGEWATEAPAAALLEAAAKDAAEPNRILALQGFAKVVQKTGKKKASDVAAQVEQALRIATRTDEKKAVLAVLGQFPCERSLKLAQALSADAELKTEAEMAVSKIEKGLQKK